MSAKFTATAAPAALLAHGYPEDEVARRLTSKKSIIRKSHDPDSWLPAGLPMAGLRDDDPAGIPLPPEQLVKLRGAYGELARRSRHVLTVRLGLATEQLTLRRGAEPLGLRLDRVRQLQVLALDRLTDAVASDDADERGPVRDAITDTLRALAAGGTT